MLSTVEEKLDYLSELENDIDFKVIYQLSNDSDFAVRSRCAEVLALFPCKETERILMKLLSDKDALVRADACDSLYFSESKEVFNALKLRLTDNNYLVRGYASLSLSDISNNIADSIVKNEAVAILKERLKKESDKWVKASLLYSLVSLNEQSYFPCFVEMLHDEDYRNRIFVLNSLENMEAYPCREQLGKHLTDQLQNEPSEVVREKINELLKRLA